MPVKINNLEEMGLFLERYNLPRLNQEEIENMNRLITSTKMETALPSIHPPIQSFFHPSPCLPILAGCQHSRYLHIYGRPLELGAAYTYM